MKSARELEASNEGEGYAEGAHVTFTVVPRKWQNIRKRKGKEILIVNKSTNETIWFGY